MTKIWYKNSDPTKIISTGKSVGNPDESFIESSILPDDDEFYRIQNSIIVRKSQAEIDTIIAARHTTSQLIIDELNKALANITVNDLADLSYDNIDTYINNVTDLASAKVVLKKYGKIILGIIKYLKDKK